MHQLTAKPTRSESSAGTGEPKWPPECNPGVRRLAHACTSGSRTSWRGRAGARSSSGSPMMTGPQFSKFSATQTGTASVLEESLVVGVAPW